MGFPWPSVVGPAFCCLGVFILLLQRWKYEGRVDLCGKKVVLEEEGSDGGEEEGEKT